MSFIFRWKLPRPRDDAVAFAEAPHADDGLVPVGEGSGESDDGSEAASLERFDKFEELRDQFAAFGIVGGNQEVSFVDFHYVAFYLWASYAVAA